MEVEVEDSVDAVSVPVPPVDDDEPRVVLLGNSGVSLDPE